MSHLPRPLPNVPPDVSSLTLPASPAAALASAVLTMARHRFGALLVVEPAMPTARLPVLEGIAIDAILSAELVVACFLPESLNSLNRGAMLVRGARIVGAEVRFDGAELGRPLHAAGPSADERNRAIAAGLAARTGVCAILVREDNGAIVLFDSVGERVLACSSEREAREQVRSFVEAVQAATESAAP